MVCLAAGLLAGCAPGKRVVADPADRSEILGKVSRAGSGVAGAAVLAVPVAADPSAGFEPVATARSGTDGTFRLTPPPGVYLVLARTTDAFAFFGRNPVRLRTRLDGLNLPLVPVHPTKNRTVPPGAETLAGRVLDRGRPLAGARVVAYLDATRGLRGPGYARSAVTGPDGAYRISLPPGTYFVAARARHDRRDLGALVPGDRFGVLPAFPLRVRAGTAVSADIETVVVPSRDRMARYHGTEAVLTGRIVDGEGRPLSGLRACLYTNPQMLDRPASLSEPTGPDGRFLLRTPLAGPLFLGARERLGGPPDPGERIGFYLGPAGTRLDVPAGGRLDGLTIVVRSVP